ncbi:MAG: hypothetical protein K9M98_13040 [Cephaloticoccus sp.]|nr:hypothetical protein [Akkermansiaceae bacterium]MCF7761418.1 hypothetical protein [Cephaloticoccus sp.]
MKIPRVLALAALLLTVLPAALFAAGYVEDHVMKVTMLVGTVLWFTAAPQWLRGGND